MKECGDHGVNFKDYCNGCRLVQASIVDEASSDAFARAITTDMKFPEPKPTMAEALKEQGIEAEEEATHPDTDTDEPTQPDFWPF